MVKPQWIVLNRRSILGLLGATALLFIIFRGAGSYYAKISVPPEELFAAALQKTLKASSFRFSMQVKIGGSQISDVQGERVAPNSVHITGTMQNVPVEFIHTGEETFIKGYKSDNWYRLQDNKMHDAELFVTEFNPLGNLNFKDIPIIKFSKTEEVKGEKLTVMELQPIVQNMLMELNFDDFFYRVWIDPKKQVIRKAHIQATGKHGKKDKLEILLEMWDYDKQLKIVKPDI